jgi:hypothetical protein
MTITSRVIETNRFRFTLEGLQVRMESKKLTSVMSAPATAVAQIRDNEIYVYTSDKNVSGAGPSACVSSSFTNFVSILVKSDLGPIPKWWQNPFNFQRRMAEWEATNANPTFFDLTTEESSRWSEMCSAVRSLCHGHRVIADTTLFSVYGYQSRKGYGGGENIIDSEDVRFVEGNPERSHTNLSVPGLVCGQFEMWFFPQFMLMQTSVSNFGAATYSGVRVEIKEGTFISNEYWPNSEVVGTTWRYVNKDGGPDRRYAQNEQLNIIRVWELDLISGSDRFDFQTTNINAARALAKAFQNHPK